MAWRADITIDLNICSVQVLAGPAHFLAWERDVKDACTRHDCWELITSEEDILDDPGDKRLKKPDGKGWYDKDSCEAQQLLSSLGCGKHSP